MNPLTAVRAAIATAVFALFSLASVSADPALSPPATRVPPLDRAEMRNWLADGEKGIWIQMRNLRWFYARLTGGCPGLASTNSLSFGTDRTGHLDRMTSVVVPERGSCRVARLSPSTGPARDRNVKVVLQPQSQ
jgi:hypothetical protein